MYRIDREKVFWRHVEGETIILNIESGLYYTVDGVGSLAWSMIVEGRPDDQILERILSTYDVSPESAARDLKRWVESLKKEKLIETKGPHGRHA